MSDDTPKMEPELVPMGALKVVENPGVLTCIGLGSCVGIALYDPVKRIGGLAHVMLPKRSEAKTPFPPGKFADSSIDLMVKEMVSRGSAQGSIRAKLFGGANMFPKVQGNSGMMGVGERNVRAVKEELAQRRIPVVAQEVGGTTGRTIRFNLQDGSVLVRTIRGEERIY